MLNYVKIMEVEKVTLKETHFRETHFPTYVGRPLEIPKLQPCGTSKDAGSCLMVLQSGESPGDGV